MNDIIPGDDSQMDTLFLKIYCVKSAQKLALGWDVCRRNAVFGVQLLTFTT